MPSCNTRFSSKHRFSLLISFLVIILFLSVSSNLFSQRPSYKISANLSPSGLSLTGTIDISYTNNSSESLDKLGIHLWPNAYKERNTALVEQKLNQGDLTLYRTAKENLGGLFDLNFTSPDQSVQLTQDGGNIDISWIKLSEPLLPGATIHIKSPYTLKIPLSFSRMGRTSTSYQLSQWYPHIAVYDAEGWHMMPYLDQGEYFNDFADYEVTITMPKEYKVAATGELVSTQENGQITQRVYSASNVIDFAWFADREFVESTKQVDVGRDKTVDLHIFTHTNEKTWDKAMMYAERALQFYSEWLGPYPYDNMSVVYTPFSKAGYMEYPMVAEIGFTPDPEFLDRVIAHEIGHTWLYGILANNERKNPWLDEGFNSFLENLYMEKYYDAPVEFTFPKILHGKHSMPDYDAYQHFVRATGKLQPPLTPPERQGGNQYVFSAYYLPLQGLNFMMEKVGPEKMKEMLRHYYDQHKFTHVSITDV
ncbi:MAG TPA: M1 family metallopeptidase, partial [Saprospiraceae bacterium]|nr:M1 family metallopeptidase [Saprospiraceae bacterium]